MKGRIPASAVIIIVSVALLIAFVFIDLEKDEDPVIRETDLERIDYNSDDFSYSLYQDKSLLRKRWSVEINGVKRRGSGNVQNIFRDLERLKHSGSYPVTANLPGKKDFCVQVYEDSNDNPVDICAHEKSPSNTLMITVSEIPDEFFLVQPYQLTRFQSDPKNLIERRIFIYEAGSKTTRIEIKSGEKELSLVLKKKVNENGEETDAWYDDKSGIEIPLNQARQLESYIRSISAEQYPEEMKSEPEEDSFSIEADKLEVKVYREGDESDSTERITIGRNQKTGWIVSAPDIILQKGYALISDTNAETLHRQFQTIVSFREAALKNKTESEKETN